MTTTERDALVVALDRALQAGLIGHDAENFLLTAINAALAAPSGGVSAKGLDEARGELSEVLAFLDGSGELDGCTFGESPAGKPRYWWRTALRQRMGALDAAVVNLIPPQTPTPPPVAQEAVDEAIAPSAEEIAAQFRVWIEQQDMLDGEEDDPTAKYLKAALPYLTRPVAQGEAVAWRDISTAPRDGTFVEVITRDGREVGAFYAKGSGWMQDDGWFYCEPVQWRPRTTPPKTGE